MADAEYSEIIDVQEMNLEEWLNLVFSSKNEEYIFIDYMFPNNFIRDEYLETIQDRDEKEVIDLLRKFLIPSGTFPSDKYNLEFLSYCKKNDKNRYEKLINTEFYKRLLNCAINKKIPPWEGNTWIIDLLPHDPKLAIDAIEAYFIAHIQFLPDGRFSGFQDAKSIIRHKFFYLKQPYEILFTINHRDFEYLISALYHEMGYKTKVTKKTRDGGVDVKITNKSIGKKEESLISCKQYKTKKVSVGDIRDLFGVVSDVKANRGILVTTSDFSDPAKKFASKNNIELINKNRLNELLNKYFGTKWPLHLDYKINEEKNKNKKSSKIKQHKN